ncbi:MAG: hypothetical protein WDM77_00250 [Steroidobacteraceae bacterium]
MDPSGEWGPRFDEDRFERIPGPEIGDYLGLPINDAARLRGDSWDAALLELQGKPVSRPRIGLRLAGSLESEHLERSGAGHAAGHCLRALKKTALKPSANPAAAGAQKFIWLPRVLDAP